MQNVLEQCKRKAARVAPAMIILALMAAGCMRIQTEHEVKPIHITVDVNLRVQRELQDFFQDIDAADPTLKQPAGSETPAEQEQSQ